MHQNKKLRIRKSTRDKNQLKWGVCLHAAHRVHQCRNEQLNSTRLQYHGLMQIRCHFTITFNLLLNYIIL